MLTIHQSELLCTQIAALDPGSVSVMVIMLFCVGISIVAIGYDEPVVGVPDTVAFALPLFTATVPDVAFHLLPSVAVPREPVVFDLDAKLS